MLVIVQSDIHGGEFHVHADGCADLGKKKYEHTYPMHFADAAAVHAQVSDRVRIEVGYFEGYKVMACVPGAAGLRKAIKAVGERAEREAGF